MGAPFVSVVIPTYQRRELVREAVESVLAQTYPDLEAIVVDDGSTDGTGDALAGLDERVRYQWQENRGVSAARNTGLRLARGNVVAFLDSDDRWLSDHAETVVGVLERYPEAVLASTCPHFRVSGDEWPEAARLVDPLPAALITANIGFVACIAVRREALLAAGGFDERLAAGEDMDLWTRLALLGPFALVQRRTVELARSPGGRHERGRQPGEYLAAIALSAERVLDEVRRLPGAEARGLLEPAEAAVRLAAALGAIARRETDVARHELAEACRLAPMLSKAPRLVVWRFGHTASTPRGLAESFSLAARLWPEPDSPTARVLRTRSLELAAGSGSVGSAALLAADRVRRLRRGLGRRIQRPAGP